MYAELPKKKNLFGKYISVLYFEHIHWQCITQGVEVYCVLLLTASNDELLPLCM